MKRLFFHSVLLGIFLIPLSVLAGDAKPKPAKAEQPEGVDAAPAAEPGGEANPSADPSDQETAKPTRRKITARPTSIDVIPEAGGMKTLNIHFRWSLYPDASIEVRLLPTAKTKAAAGDKLRKKAQATRASMQVDPDAIDMAPVYFHELLKDKVQEHLFDCLDHPENAGRIYSFTKDKVVYKMIGRRNSLGNQAVHVQVYKEESDLAESPAAAYLQLDTWAVDNEVLSLDLARDEFAQPGKLFVWFFRGDQSVWEEQLHWPGYK